MRLRLLLLLSLASVCLAPVHWRFHEDYFDDPATCGAEACGSTYRSEINSFPYWDRILASPTVSNYEAVLALRSRRAADGEREIVAVVCEHCGAKNVVQFRSGPHQDTLLRLDRTAHVHFAPDRFGTPACSGDVVQTGGDADGRYDVEVRSRGFCAATASNGNHVFKLALYRSFPQVPECDSVYDPWTTQGEPWESCCTGPLQGTASCGCMSTGTCASDAVPELAQIPWLPPLYEPAADDIGIGIGAGSPVTSDDQGWYLECDELGNDPCCIEEFNGTGNPWTGADPGIGGRGNIVACDSAGLTYLGSIPEDRGSVPIPSSYSSPDLSDGTTHAIGWSFGFPLLLPQPPLWRDLQPLPDRVGEIRVVAESSQVVMFGPGWAVARDWHCAVGEELLLTNTPSFGGGASPPSPKGLAEDGCIASVMAATPGDSGGPVFIYDASTGGWYYTGASGSLTAGRSSQWRAAVDGALRRVEP